MDSNTWQEIDAERRRRAKEEQDELLRWSRSVTERLMNEQSSFAREFDENERRIFGLSIQK
jgi:hypothetical protein